jgi:hypothetical protein
MKQFFSYGLLTAALLLHVAVINTHVPVRDASVFSHAGDTGHDPEEGHSYIMPEAPFIPAGLNSISNPRIPVFFFKTVNNPYNTLQSCFLNLTIRQIHITRSAYFSHYSKKEKDGYYLYALRKLLI